LNLQIFRNLTAALILAMLIADK